MVVKGNDKIAAPDVYVWEGELTLEDANIKSVFEKLGLEYVLHNLWGFDNSIKYKSTGSFYEVHVCKRRNRCGKIVEGIFYLGKERLDDVWIEQGAPSGEAKVAARQDMSYIREVKSLSRQMKSL